MSQLRLALACVTTFLPLPGSAGVFAGEERASSGDWPQWRGPHRDGISRETGLLESWPEEGPKLEWTAKGLGTGYSSVVVAGDRVYTMGQSAEGGDQDVEPGTHAIALDRATGDAVWSVRVGRGGAPGWGGFDGPRSTPTVDGDRVYVLSQYGEIVCLGAKKGDVIWKRSLDDDLGGPLPEWGFSESLLIDDGRLVCTPGGAGGTLAALDKQSGKTLWRAQGIEDEAQYASIIPIEHDGKKQYVQLTQESLFGVHRESGELLWRADWPGKTAVIPTPVYHDGQVYVTSGYGVGCDLYRLGEGGEVEAVYDGPVKKRMKNHHGGVVLVDDHIYGYSDGVGWACQELATGRLVWNEKEALGKGALTYAEGRLYLREESGAGRVVLIEATPAGWREKGRFTPPDRSEKHSWAHPVVAGGKLYLRDQGVVHCYDVSKD